jgi:hypothetical protein
LPAVPVYLVVLLKVPGGASVDAEALVGWLGAMTVLFVVPLRRRFRKSRAALLAAYALAQFVAGYSPRPSGQLIPSWSGWHACGHERHLETLWPRRWR